MARPRKETDLKAQVKKRYEELLKERNEIEDELKGLQVYLKAVGEIRTQRRGRRKKAEPAAPVPSKTVEEPKPKAAGERKPQAKRKKRSATDSILSLIGKSTEGISIDQIMKQTRLGRLTVNGVLTRMKKVGKVKSAGRGIYVKA